MLIFTGYLEVTVKNFNEAPPKVSYRLSDLGIKALKIVGEIELFGKELESKEKHNI